MKRLFVETGGWMSLLAVGSSDGLSPDIHYRQGRQLRHKTNNVPLMSGRAHLSIRVPPMTYSQDKSRIFNDGINNPVVSDPKFP